MRFEFGKNWQAYARSVEAAHLEEAKQGLLALLEPTDLAAKEFLDIGCGSGLSSLAAVELGARVIGFDFDTDSVDCSQALRQRFNQQEANWKVMQGSVLDQAFMESLGRFDVVYSWGVLHHTGDMETAIANIVRMVKPGGKLVLALYHDQGWLSRYWLGVKVTYNSSPPGRWAMIALHWPCLFALRRLVHWRSGRSPGRGMSLWYDMLDWLGGYPFEVAKPQAVICEIEGKGFQVEKTRLVGNRSGCNEFVFFRPPGESSARDSDSSEP